MELRDVKVELKVIPSPKCLPCGDKGTILTPGPNPERFACPSCDLGKWLTGKLGLSTYEAKIEVEKKMSKKNNEFVKGYACAISTIVAGHGEDTATREALGAYGIETREKARKAGVDPYDLDVIFPRKSNRRRRKE